MLELISWKDFQLWRAYGQLEPFDEERSDLRSASIVAAIWNVHRDTKKHPKPFTALDFVLPFGDYKPPSKPQQSAEEMEAIGRMVAAAYGAKVPGTNC